MSGDEGHAASVIGCQDLSTGYGELAAASGITIDVAAGEVVALLGPNGAGKTTTLLTLVGILKPMSGDVLWRSEPVSAALNVRARQGLSFVPEEKSVVMSLSAEDNLRVAGVSMADAVAVFPELGRLASRRAGLLSGGEQQMLTVARALARRPAGIIVDELSLGLAPIVARRLSEALRSAADSGTAVLVVEQNIRRALHLSDRFYVMRQGRMIAEGHSSEFRQRVADVEAMLVPA